MYWNSQTHVQKDTDLFRNTNNTQTHEQADQTVAPCEVTCTCTWTSSPTPWLIINSYTKSYQRGIRRAAKAAWFSFLAPLGITLHTQGCGAFACAEGNVPPLAEELARLTALLHLVEEESSPPAIEAQRWSHTLKAKGRAQTFWRWEHFFSNSHQCATEALATTEGWECSFSAPLPSPLLLTLLILPEVISVIPLLLRIGSCRSDNRHSCPVLSFHPSPPCLGDKGSSPDWVALTGLCLQARAEPSPR